MSKSDLCQCGHSREVHNYPGTQQYDDAGGTPCLACKCLSFKPQAPKANGRRALEQMTDAELQARLVEVRKTLSTINDNARGCSYYKSIPQVKAEYDRNQYEKHAIVKMLAERQQAQEHSAGTLYHVEYFTLSDGRAAKDVRAATEDAARSMVQDSGDCEMIVNVSVN